MAFSWVTINRFFSGAAWRSPGMQNGDSSGGGVVVPKSVTLDGALQLSAAWACISLITRTIAATPIVVYRVDPKSGERVVLRDHYLAMLFNGKMNRWQTRQEAMETLVYQNTALGNDYSLIHSTGKGLNREIIALEPLMAPQMQVTLLDSGAIQYRYNDGRRDIIYSEDQIWHNKCFGNGIIGLSPLSYARQTLGIGMAAEDSVAKVYANGGKSSGVLTIDKVLKPEQREKIRENYNELHSGNNARMFILEAGMKWERVSLSPQDIEMLSSRRFQIEDIARFYGVPSALINDMSGTTVWGSGVQQILEGFYKFNLKPSYDRYAASIKNRLLRPDERPFIEIGFDVEALLAPSFAERVKTGKEAVTGALLKPDEWRKKEGLPPVEGGNELYMQQQNVPLRLLDKIARPAMEAKPDASQSQN